LWSQCRWGLHLRIYLLNMSCGVLISSVKFSGQTCQVTFLEDGTNQTFLLGEETIPFTFFPADGTVQHPHQL